MARNSVRTDVGEPGQGSWVDQAGRDDGSTATYDVDGVVSHDLHFETLTVSTTALAFAEIPPEATSAFVTVATTGSRVRLDGVNPTSSVGHLYNDASTFTLNTRREVQNARFIRSGSDDSTLSISYGRRRSEAVS